MTKAQAEKKVQIIIDKLLDLQDYFPESYDIRIMLDMARKIESKINRD